MVEGRFPRPFALAALAADSPGRLSTCFCVSILCDRELTSPICLVTHFPSPDHPRFCFPRTRPDRRLAGIQEHVVREWCQGPDEPAAALHR